MKPDLSEVNEKVKRKVSAGVQQAKRDGLYSRWDSLRRIHGRDQPVSPGFDPWSSKLSLGPGQIDKVNWSEWAQVAAAQGIKKRKGRVRKGDGRAILEAILLAVDHGLVAPDWLASTFAARMEAFLGFERLSLNSAFGIRPITERKRSQQYEKLYLIPAVHRVLRGLFDRDPARGVGADLFVEAGEILGIGGTKCHALYAEGVRRYKMPDLQLYRTWVKRGSSPTLNPGEST